MAADTYSDSALPFMQCSDIMIEKWLILGKHFTRKDSADSGISAGSSSRKTSTISSVSSGGILEEPSEETIREETPFEQPDEDLCEKITQQVTFV